MEIEQEQELSKTSIEWLDSSNMLQSELHFFLQSTIVNTITETQIVDDVNVAACYVLDLATNCENTYLAAASSNHFIKIYDKSSFSVVTQLAGHQSRINEVHFAQTSPFILFSCSEDQTICLWDIREARPAQIYRGEKEVLSFSVGDKDSLLASGVGGSVKLWDTRSTKSLTTYSDFHPEDITQIRFHPTQGRLLFSGSIDGTICEFDTNQLDEEEAYKIGINVDDSVNRIEFCGPSLDCVAFLTGTERFSIWSIQGEKLVDYEDARKASSEHFQLDYCIGCKFDPSQNKLFLLAGSFKGTAAIFECHKDGLVLLCILPEGHVDVVRGFEWNLQLQQLITAGEDSRICVWGPENPLLRANDALSSSKGKIPSPTRVEFQTAHQKKPYSRKG